MLALHVLAAFSSGTLAPLVPVLAAAAVPKANPFVFVTVSTPALERVASPLRVCGAYAVLLPLPTRIFPAAGATEDPVPPAEATSTPLPLHVEPVFVIYPE